MTFWSILRQRCWGLVLVVAGVCVITFIISHLIPGDPARLLAGDRASDAIVEKQQRRALAEELAVQVGIRPEYLDRLPHAFSGGQRQRIAIARALSSQPDVIVLDEPTSALDISVQAQILNLLVTLQENHGLTYVLISHNVSVIRHMSDRVAVMYLGQIVELGDAQQVLTAPAHPYTRLLLDSLPAIDKPLEEEWALRKTDLPGNRTLPQGCFFYERCPLATHGCEVRQSLAIREDGRELRCWRAL